MNPLGLFLEPPGPLLTHLPTLYLASSKCLSARLNPLAERTCFSQVEQGWIRAEAVELDEAADSIVVQMASMDVGTDVGAAPVEAGKETEDSKKANGDHHKAWAESERTVHTARKASPCSRRIALALLLQAACVVATVFVVIAFGAGWTGTSWSARCSSKLTALPPPPHPA